MKRVIQLVLLSFLILIAVIFYKVYLSTPEQIQQSIIKNQDQFSEQTENNLIRNLKYDVKFDDNNQYIITADLSEIGYQNDIEIVNMQKVIAIFVDETNVPLTITSNKAIYNNTNYNTNFFFCPPDKKSALISLIGSNSNLEISEFIFSFL